MPDSPAPRTFSAAALFASLGAAVVAFMLLAVVSPRWSAEEEVSWLIAFVGALVAAVATYALLATRGREEKKADPTPPPR